MSENAKVQQASGLIEFKKQQHQESTTRILKAISKIRQRYNQGKIKRITVSEIAREAGVCINTIYKNPPLLERIKQIKIICECKNDRKMDERSKTIGYLQESFFQNRLKQLKEEIALLKDEKAILIGHLERKTTECMDWQARYKILEGKVKNIVPFK